MGKILEVGNSKVTLRRLKNKSVLRYLRFQVLSTRFSVTGPVPKNTCDQIIEKKIVSSLSIDINLSSSQK